MGNMLRSHPRKCGERLRDSIKSGDISAIKDVLSEMRESNIDIDMPIGPLGEAAVLYAVEKEFENEEQRHIKAAVIDCLIKEGCDVNKSQENQLGFTALYGAIRRNDLTSVETLLKNGADVNKQTKTKDYPIILSCGMGHLEMVELLCKHGADCNVPSPGPGGTPLVLAIQSGNPSSLDIAKTLVAHGCDPHKTNRIERTSFHAAAEALCDITLCIDYLVELQVDINKRDYRGCTPLMMAAQANRANILKKLLENGADPAICDNDGKTAFDYAEKQNHEKALAVLKSWRRRTIAEEASCPSDTQQAECILSLPEQHSHRVFSAPTQNSETAFCISVDT